MTKIRKGVDRLPSGAYRYRLREGGVSYTFTDSVLLSAREARERFTKLIADSGSAHKGGATFGDASQRHLKAVSAVLSPSTLYFYQSIDKRLRMGYKWLYDKPVRDITADDVQSVIGEYGKDKAKYTAKGVLSYIRIVLRQYDIEIGKRVRVGGARAKKPYIPTSAEVSALLGAVKGTDFDVPFKLALLGLRRSEICGLGIDDLDGDRIHIRRSKVYTSDGLITKDSVKTSASDRVIIIPHQLAEQIRSQGYVYEGSPTYLTEKMRVIQDRLGLPHFSLHKLRHYYASQAHALGVPDSYVMRAAGWASDGILRIYRHALDDKADDYDMVTVNFLDDLMTKS